MGEFYFSVTCRYLPRHLVKKIVLVQSNSVLFLRSLGFLIRHILDSVTQQINTFGPNLGTVIENLYSEALNSVVDPYWIKN